MIANMVTKIQKGRRTHLYIKEWADFRGLSDQRIAERLGVARETVYRWRTDQDRLDPGKIAGLASALDCEPFELWLRPQQESLDAIVKGVPDEIRQKAVDIVRLLVKKAS
jgi:transcriptional regulator with XRE-family HTH domain